MTDDMAKNLKHGVERSKREREIVERMEAMHDEAKAEGRDFTDDEKKSWNDLREEHERLRAEMGRDQALVEMRGEIEKRITPPGAKKELTREDAFAEIGGVAQALARAKGIRVNAQERQLTSESGSTGGYLIGSELMRTIMSVDPEREIIRSRAMVIPAGDQPNASFDIPYYDQSTSVAGGLEFRKRAEEAEMHLSSMDFGLLKLEPTERSTYVQVGKKTVVNGDAVGLGAFIANFFSREKQATEDYLFFNGDGTNEPLGLLNSTAKVTVSRDTSNQIEFVDITKMYIRMLDQVGAIWVANKTAMEEIVQVADAGDNNLVFRTGDVSRGIPNTLFGFPLLTTTNVPTLGTEGDLMFVNPGYYIIKDGRAWELLVYDVRPEYQLIDYVGVWDVDGASWVANAIEMNDGNTYSPIVALGDA